MTWWIESERNPEIDSATREQNSGTCSLCCLADKQGWTAQTLHCCVVERTNSTWCGWVSRIIEMLDCSHSLRVACASACMRGAWKPHLCTNRCAVIMSQAFFVRNLQNQTSQVSLEPGLTIREVKERLAKEQNISPDQIRLVYGGKELQDNNKVTDYNVGPGSNVNMVLRLQGGIWPQLHKYLILLVVRSLRQSATTEFLEH